MTRRRQPRLFVASALALVALAATTSDSPLRADGSGCQFANIDRIVAVGAVHGAYDRFVEILRASDILDARLRWVGGRTHLVQLGDIVDRGPDSAKALDLLERLAKDAARAGGAVHLLLGNHEVMRMLGDLRYTTPSEYAAFASSQSKEVRDASLERAKAANEPAGAAAAAGFVELRRVRPEWPIRQAAAIADASRQDQRHVFVHGGISPAPPSSRATSSTTAPES
jgi:hypothetical protein